MPSILLDAHVYPPGVMRPTKLRMPVPDPAAAMHLVARNQDVPSMSVVLLVEGEKVVSRVVLTAKRPVRLTEAETKMLIKERDPGKRMRLMAEIIRRL